MRIAALFIAAGAFILSLAGAPAQALITRVWVSGKGVDATTCGAVTSPCRTFQYVHDNIIAAGGEIDVLDPAGYGSLTIAKAISIVNDGIGSVGVPAPSGGTAITVNAGANDKIFLKGLTVDGFGSGQLGLRFNSGGYLTVTGCTFRNMTSHGILIYSSTPAYYAISHTIASDNGYAGIYVNDNGANSHTFGAITDVETNNNGDGGVVIRNTEATLTHMVASGNYYGIWADLAVVHVDDSNVSNNAVAAFYNTGGGIVRLSRVTASGNPVGVSTPNGGIVQSFGDNHISALYGNFVGGTLSSLATN